MSLARSCAAAARISALDALSFAVFIAASHAPTSARSNDADDDDDAFDDDDDEFDDADDDDDDDAPPPLPDRARRARDIFALAHPGGGSGSMPFLPAIRAPMFARAAECAGDAEHEGSRRWAGSERKRRALTANAPPRLLP